VTDKITLGKARFMSSSFHSLASTRDERTAAHYKDGCFWTTNEAAYDDAARAARRRFDLHRDPT
jgi:hypothetical protein